MLENETPSTPAIEGVEVVTLDCPIQRGETEITQVTLRKPLAGQLRGIKLAELLNLDVGSVQLVLPRISTPSLQPHEIAQLDPADLAELGVKVAAFFVRKSSREAFQTVEKMPWPTWPGSFTGGRWTWRTCPWSTSWNGVNVPACAPSNRVGKLMSHGYRHPCHRATSGTACRRNHLLHGLGGVQRHLQVNAAAITAQGIVHG